MARTIDEIKKQIAQAYVGDENVRTAYGLESDVSFDKAFSPVSLESLMFYIVASCIWLLEKMFDHHRQEIDNRIESLRPHTLRWYVSKTLAYMHKKDLVMTDGVVVADYYDTSGMSDEEIEKARVVKYAVATESNSQVLIKVAARSRSGLPTQLNPDALEGLKYYLSQIKDAGVALKVINDPADNMRVELIVLYDSSILTAAVLGAPDGDGYSEISLLRDGENVIWKAVSDVISHLPFNGEYRNSDLMAAVQAIDGVRVADIVKVEAAPGGSDVYTPVKAYRRPFSGYYSLDKLSVKGRPYKVAETS